MLMEGEHIQCIMYMQLKVIVVDIHMSIIVAMVTAAVIKGHLLVLYAATISLISCIDLPEVINHFPLQINAHLICPGAQDFSQHTFISPQTFHGIAEALCIIDSSCLHQRKNSSSEMSPQFRVQVCHQILTKAY